MLYFTIASSFTAIQLYGEFRVEKNNLKIQVESLGETFSSILSEAIWNYDDTQVLATIAGIYKNSEVFGIKVQNKYEDSWHLGYYRSEDGAIIRSSGGDASTEDAKAESVADDGKTINFDYSQLYEVSMDLYKEYKGKLEVVGTQTVYFSSVTVFERTWMTFVITFVAAMLKTMALWIISIFVVNRIVAVPLRGLTAEIGDFEVDTLTPVSTSSVSADDHKKDEIYFLQSSFFTLRNELIARNKEIERRKNRLEAMVAERTKSLDETLIELKDASKVKDVFIATMSHEIRTPLNSVLGCVGLLKRTDLTERQKNLALKISRGGNNLMSMLDDILDWSKMEANMLVLERVPFDLVGAMLDAVETFSSSAAEKSLTLSYTPNDDYFFLSVYGDPTRLAQVLNNLINNGIKFTAEGFVTLSLEVQSIEEMSRVEQIINFNVIVEDSGIGIDESDQSSLFVAFKQADDSTTRRFGGSGLGLAICKKIVESMGGEIRIESEPGKGSKFIVSLSLPLATRLEEKTIPEPAVDVSCHYANVLFVENSEAGHKQIVNVLEGFGHIVTRTTKINEGVEQYKINHSELDLILVDCLFLEEGGCEAVRQIRAFELAGNLKVVKIIAITEDADEKKSVDCFDAGVDALANKLSEPRELLKLVNSLTGYSWLE